MPYDLALFAIVVAGFFVIGLPRIVGSIHIPAEVELQEVPEYELTDRQRIFFDEIDGKLAAMGYSPAISYRAVNMQGHNLLRTYLSDSDYAIIMLTLLRSEVENAEDQSTHYLEVITRFADGALAITRNAELSEELHPGLRTAPAARPGRLAAAVVQPVDRFRGPPDLELADANTAAGVDRFCPLGRSRAVVPRSGWRPPRNDIQ